MVMVRVCTRGCDTSPARIGARWFLCLSPHDHAATLHGICFLCWIGCAPLYWRMMVYLSVLVTTLTTPRSCVGIRFCVGVGCAPLYWSTMVHLSVLITTLTSPRSCVGIRFCVGVGCAPARDTLPARIPVQVLASLIHAHIHPNSRHSLIRSLIHSLTHSFTYSPFSLNSAHFRHHRQREPRLGRAAHTVRL